MCMSGRKIWAVVMTIVLTVMIAVAGYSSSCFAKGKTITETKAYLNGNLSDESEAVYSYMSNFGNLFAVAFTTSNSTIMLTAVAPTEDCYCGASFYDEELEGDAFLDLVLIVNDKYYEYTSVDNPDVFSNMVFELSQYEEDSATFAIATDFVHGKRNYTVEVYGVASYQEASQNTGNTQDNDNQNDGTCLYCYGTGKCTICNGMGYTMWGGYSSRIECTSCHGSGECYYCEGTGIQVYITRDYRK